MGRWGVNSLRWEWSRVWSKIELERTTKAENFPLHWLKIELCDIVLQNTNSQINASMMMWKLSKMTCVTKTLWSFLPLILAKSTYLNPNESPILSIKPRPSNQSQNAQRWEDQLHHRDAPRPFWTFQVLLLLGQVYKHKGVVLRTCLIVILRSDSNISNI